MPERVPTDPHPILARLEALGIRLGLDNARGLLARLGDPQLRVPAVLVAGSNGKGSTSALLAAMATAAGYRTGLYTSPHLESVEERLRLDGRPIETGRLGELLAGIVDIAEPLPTYFEAVTIAAFRWFAEEAVDLAVIEVGLGGRLDATNLADPILSLITSISLEHREFLGDTLAAIAREKAGILRPGRPALAWVEAPEAAETLRQAADELGADLRSAPGLVRLEGSESDGWAGQRVRLATPGGRYDLWTALLGAHQQRNLGLAVLAAETLAGAGFPRLDREAITAGAAACRWPGRLEPVELPGRGSTGRRVLLDAAHNTEGAEVLAGFLDAMGSGPVDLLFGVLQDKDADAMLSLFAPRARHLVLTTPASPRAIPPADLAARLGPREGLVVEPDPGRALDRLLELSDPPDTGAGTAVVCGSIYLIGDIRKALRKRFGVPAPPFRQ